MILGPVFHAELMTTSRRRRYYVARLAYGLTLLALVGATYEGMRRDREAAVSTAAPGFAFLAEAAEAVFSTFLATQVAAVLCLTPAMVAGSIADERRRKTLPYLLASRLSSPEIVVGKLAARLLQLVVLVLTGLPIMSILSLFGGLDPPLVVVAFLGTLTTAFALAGLSVLVSTLARRPRDAIAIVYVIEVLWLAGPTIVAAIVGPTSPGALAILGRFTDPFLRLDPFQLTRLASPMPDLLARLTWMAGLQVALGAAFVGLAVWRLRPASANSDRGPTADPRPSLLARALGRPPIGDDPMAWKERHVARLGTAIRSLAVLLTVFAAVFLGDVLLDLGRPALAELREHGYGDAPGADVHKARDELNEMLRHAGAAACAIWLLGLAGTTAAGITSEREDDTWTGLLGTTLTGREILRGKAIGALWRWRVAGLTALGLWALGLALGAIHPLGLAMALALFAAYTAFALALGSFVSLRSRSTTRALVATMAVLFMLNGGFLLGGIRDEPWLDARIVPYVIDVAPERYAPMGAFLGTHPMDNIRLRLEATTDRLATCLVSLIGYGVAATVLAAAAVFDFDRLADRPRRGT